MRQSTQAAKPKDTTVRTYEFKIRPNKKFVASCEAALDASRFVYNCALEQRISQYKQTGKGVGFYEQSRQLTEARKELPEVKAVLRTIQADALERLDDAFTAFFKRCKDRKKKTNGRKKRAGFPRFKGHDRYRTFSQQIETQRGCPLKGDKLTVPGVGFCRVRLSRPIEGRCKQLRTTKRADGWFALLVCEVTKPEPLPKTGKTIAIDVGIKCFAALSNGEEIANPRFTKAAAKNLTKQQRRLSRKKKGSSNRRKARQIVALAHLKVQRTRKHFHHETAAKLVKRFDRITIENLNIAGMMKNHHLAKAIADVAWNSFFLILTGVAGNAGREIVNKEARYTSMTCSRCGHRQKMPLAVRIFTCEACGFVIGRDHNAAINLEVGMSESRTYTPVDIEALAYGNPISETSVAESGTRLVETSASPVRTERVTSSSLRH